MQRPDHSRAMNFLGAIALSLADKMGNGIEAKTGLSPALSSALIQIGMYPGENMAHLRRMIGLSQPHTSRTVDQLVGDGLVSRVRGQTDDSRFTVLNLTPAGTRMMEAALQARYDVLGSALSALDASERGLFETMLGKVLPHVAASLADSRVMCRLCDFIGCPQDICPGEDCFSDALT